MSEPRFQVIINCPGPNNPTTNLVVESATGRVLGGFGSNFYRSWVFPLYTPRGFTVLQEFAFDHPFHNGLFVSQNPVKVGDRVGNFWVAPPQRSFDDPVNVHVGRMDPVGQPTAEVFPDAVRFTQHSVWRDEHEEPMIDEVRTVVFRATTDATVCDMTSRKIASYGAVEYPQTKYGSIGVRVEPRLLPPLGGVIHADAERRGRAAILENRESDFVAYEMAIAPQSRFGICLIVPGKRGPWFIRDYGMAMHNPTLSESISVPVGGEWNVSLRAIAYDEKLAPERVLAWQSIQISDLGLLIK